MAILRDTATVHITDNEVSRNFAAVRENIRKGVEVVVEQDHRLVALIRSLTPEDRSLSDCIALAEARGSSVPLDEGFNERCGRGHCQPHPAMEPADLGVILDSSIVMEAE